MSIFTSKSKHTQFTKELTGLYIQPEADDVAAIQEIETQRIKWREFLRSRNYDFSEEWLWQNWKGLYKKGLLGHKVMVVFSSKLKARKRLKSLIRAGVPPELRGAVWWACSGAEEKMKSSSAEEQYPVLLARIHELNDTSIAHDIEKDLRRTFPEIITVDHTERIDALRKLLRTYALRNQNVGYCQSMNYIGALILFHLPPEQAFWVLAAIIEDVLPPDYFISSLLGGRIDQQVFHSCIAWKLPKLYHHFKETSTLLEPIVCPWFLCLYINVLPIYAVCRVWDCLLWEGNTVLFRIGLCMMKSKAERILASKDFFGVYSVLKSADSKFNSFNIEHNNNDHTAIGPVVVAATATANMSDTSLMIHSAFGFKWLKAVPSKKIEDMREKFRELLEQEDEVINQQKIAHFAENERLASIGAAAGSENGASDQKSDRSPRAPRRSRKSSLILRALDEEDIGALRELGLQMNEGLANQVEEFARTLHNSSTISELIDDGDDDNDDNDDDSEHESNGLKSTGNHFDV